MSDDVKLDSVTVTEVISISLLNNLPTMMPNLSTLRGFNIEDESARLEYSSSTLPRGIRSSWELLKPFAPT